MWNQRNLLFLATNFFYLYIPLIPSFWHRCVRMFSKCDELKISIMCVNYLLFMLWIYVLKLKFWTTPYKNNLDLPYLYFYNNDTVKWILNVLDNRSAFLFTKNFFFDKIGPGST